MPQTDYKLTIDDSEVEKSLKDTEDNFDKMAKSGDDAMKKIGESAEDLGDGIRKNVNGRLIDANGKFVKMGESGDKAMKNVAKSGMSLNKVMEGVVAQGLVKLTGLALELGKATVGAFVGMGKAAGQAAIEFGLTQKKFTTLFAGNQEQANAMMDKVSDRASKLGLDMNEALSLSRAFIPDVKGTDDPLGALDKLLVGVRALAEEDPIQGVAGARIAIDEAMSGSLRSIRQRFEFTKTEVDILKTAQVELGQVVGTIEGINKVMERRGVDVEAMAGTFTQAVGEMTFATSKLQIEMGKPISDSLTKGINDLNKIMSENSDDLLLMAGAIGDVMGKVVEFASINLGEFIENIDTQGVMDLVDGLNGAANAAELLLDTIFNLGDDTLFNTLVKGLTKVVGKLKEASITAAQLTAMAKASNARERAEAEAFRAPLEKKLGSIGSGDISTSIEKIPGVVVDFGRALASTEEKAAAAAAGQKAYDQAIKDSLPNFEKFSDAEKADTERKKARIAEQDKDTQAALDGAEAYLKQGHAASEASEELAELGLAEEDLSNIQAGLIKNQEKLADAEEKFGQQRLDMARDFLQERADLELEFSQERADLARESLQDIAAIEEDHRRSVVDQGIDLGRDVRDMGKKHSQERADSEKDLRQDLLDVEQNYQDELRRIQRTAQQALEDAERGMDAQAFVAALRRQEVSLEDAAITRDAAEADVRDTSSQRKDDLDQAQSEERSTLQQADQDKLEDLNLRLQREFADQALSDQLALEQQAIDEERRVAQQMLDEERRIEQQAINEQRKLDALLQAQAERLAKLVEGLDEETAAVILAEANKLAAVEDFAGAAQVVLDGLVANARGRAKEALDKRTEVAERVIPEKRPTVSDSDKPIDPKSDGTGPGRPKAPGVYLPIIQKRLGGSVRAGGLYRVGEAGLEGYVPRRGFGGRVNIGQPTRVGEFGEELFIPPSSGTIIPNSQMGSFRGNSNMQQSISNTENNLGGFSVSQSMLEDPIQRAQLENFILDILSRN